MMCNISCTASLISVNNRLFVPEGEGAGLGSSQPKGAHILNIDVPFDGLGLISIPASETISPVFTMWITLVAMYTSRFAPTQQSYHQQAWSFERLSKHAQSSLTMPCWACMSSTCMHTVRPHFAGAPALLLQKHIFLVMQSIVGLTIRQLWTCEQEVLQA